VVLQLTARHCESAEGCACWQVMVSDEEPQENAVKRFRREVMNAGLTLEVCSQLPRSCCRASLAAVGVGVGPFGKMCLLMAEPHLVL